ncbi:MAG TPA: protein kinase [Polyangia bacterium]|nr:protein kinase [Polyangia bacterium]
MPFVCQKGARVGGRYELARMLGEGGMGEVWAAVHTVTRKPVALKFLKASARPDDRRRFMREARAASAVHHPSVVQIHDILEADDGTPVLVMDLLAGHTLAARLARAGSLSLGETALILAPVISAVGTAHAVGIVHRDLKPDNIFLVEHLDNRPDVKVLDFGVAKLTATEGDAAQTAGLTRTGEILGTPYYMSPEQVFGEHDVDHRADVWSLGVILYECLAGKRPFEGDNVGQVLKRVMMGGLEPLHQAAPHVPQAIAQLVDRMLSVERKGRPELREVIELLRVHTDVTVLSFADARPPLAERTDPFSRTEATDAPVAAPRPRRRRRSLAWLIAGFLVFDGAAIGGLWWWRHRAPAEQTTVPVSPQNPPQTSPQTAPQNPAQTSPQNTAQNPPQTSPQTAPQNPPTVAPVLPTVAVTPAPPVHHVTSKHKPSVKPEKEKPKNNTLPGGVVNEVPF